MNRPMLSIVAMAVAWTTSVAAQPLPEPPAAAASGEPTPPAEATGDTSTSPAGAPTPPPAAAAIDENPDARPLYTGSRKNFRFRGAISYAQTKLYTVPIRMGDFELHLGGPTRERSVVFYASVHQAIGRSQQGLHVWNTSGGFTLEMDANYVQVGLELRLSMMIVERATRDDSMVTFGMGGRPYLAVTLVPVDDESALQLLAGLGVDVLGGDDDTVNLTPSLGLGFRY